MFFLPKMMTAAKTAEKPAYHLQFCQRRQPVSSNINVK